MSWFNSGKPFDMQTDAKAEVREKDCSRIPSLSFQSKNLSNSATVTEHGQSDKSDPQLETG
jgi:hypothetical protein